MSTRHNISIQGAAAHFGITAHRLRQFLQGVGAIAWSRFGLAGTPSFHERRLIYTRAMSRRVVTDQGEMHEHIAEVLITPAGMAWLQQRLAQTEVCTCAR